MSVRELISLLEKCDPDRPVILQKDAEGNGYSPLSIVDDNCSWVGRNGWSGDVGILNLTDDLKARGFDDSDVLEGVPCVVLAPVN